MRLDAVAYARCSAGATDVTKRILLGPEIENFEPMARHGRAARPLSGPRRAGDGGRRSTTSGTTLASGLVAVALGAAIVIVLLLLTASDIARLALEGSARRVRE